MELMVVIAMTGIVVLMALPFISTAPTKADVRTAAPDAVDALREAQASVMSGKNNARFGVHFEATKIVVFQGATYGAGDANNIVHAFSGRLTVTAVALSPGGACTLPAGTGNCDVHFANHKGTPTESGSVTITGENGDAMTVTVNAAGMIDVN